MVGKLVYSKHLNAYLRIHSEDPDEMQHNAAFHQALHDLLKFKQHSGTEIHHNVENSSCDTLINTMGSLVLIVSMCILIVCGPKRHRHTE